MPLIIVNTISTLFFDVFLSGYEENNYLDSNYFYDFNVCGVNSTTNKVR